MIEYRNTHTREVLICKSADSKHDTAALTLRAEPLISSERKKHMYRN